ncbi:MAG: transcription termination/antitermination protein NusA [Candidatus Blackburnbacteria bacterium]|nr:transcription termination/antitermination protein NusA [Candidatus Blackburnbacteria bacterium]
MAALARTEFSSALNAIANESGLNPAIVLDTIKQAIQAAFRRDARERGEEIEEEREFDVELDPESGEARVFEMVESKKKDVTPPGFGRIAVQTAKQVILQKIREAEKDAILAQYEKRIGSLISGTVLRFDGPNVRVDLGRTEGLLPPQERIPNEKFALNQRLTFLLKEIRETDRGREIILSRADPEIVRRLFSREVPEIGSGSVEIKEIAREAGNRTKIAVSSVQSGVDPVGSCVGQRGVRVQAVIGELNEEKIDVIPWTDNSEQFIKSALSPSEVVSVVLDKKTKEAVVKVSEEQLSLAIGKEGQNVRLASKLTGWNIRIEGVAGEETDTETEIEEEGKSEKPVENGN